MTERLYGTAYVARYLGTSPSNITNWSKTQAEGFPLPRVEILGPSKTVTGRAWNDRQLTDLRGWMSDRLGLSSSDLESHWRQIDDLMGPIQEDAACERIGEQPAMFDVSEYM